MRRITAVSVWCGLVMACGCGAGTATGQILPSDCPDHDGDGVDGTCPGTALVDCDDSNAQHWSDCGRCVDQDGDGYGARCDLGADCDDADPDNWVSCWRCVDADGDHSFVGCDAFVVHAGPDCDDHDAQHSTDCGTCLDADGDGHGTGCAAGPDCDDASPMHFADCGVCIDVDGDGYGKGCDAGADCDDSSAAHFADCGVCSDGDGDGHGSRCDLGDDCNDDDENNWLRCASCGDRDGDGVFAYCDAYVSIRGPDCRDTLAGHWSDCGACIDADGDHYGAGCDLGGDCDDADPTHWADCSACTDLDGDGRGIGCDAGVDCDDGDANVWASCTTCADGDGDGQFAGCDAYGTVNGPDCDDTDADVWATCATCADGDSDGFFADCDAYVTHVGPDCAPTSAAHWNDCGSCVDGDSDGFGAGCNLGDDCRDDDAGINPAATDGTVNGVDENCDALDGHVTFDDFDSADADPAVWAALNSDAVVDTGVSSSGDWALRLDGGRGTATTVGIDTSACTAIVWSFALRRGPDAPELTDLLELAYFDGTAWRAVASWSGTGAVDPGFSAQHGVIRAAAARHTSFALRLMALGSGPGFDDFFIDDFRVACGLDSDADGTPDVFDCAAADPQHFADCGHCTDADGDGYGALCDLGSDCNDGNASIHPGAADLTLNNIDENCDAHDGLFVLEPFASTVLNPAVFASLSGDGAIQGTYSASFAYALNLGGGVASATTVSMDAGGCIHGLFWSYRVQRGPSAPSPSATLWLEVWDGTAWVTADSLAGTGWSDGAFYLRSGTLSAAVAAHPNLQLRLRSQGSGPGFDDFFVDDLSFGCVVDRDGDGYAAGSDCDDENPNAWTTCATCTDKDRDGRYGLCNAYVTVVGPDCNDNDANNWNACAACRDLDGDGFYAGCNAYITVVGPDCNDASAAHWSDCGTCVDSDGDNHGTGCNLGADCSDSDTNNWAACGTCVDADLDTAYVGCDRYVTKSGPDCSDGNSAISPLAADSTVDGVDQNCDGFDGLVRIDDFDVGSYDSAVWSSLSGDASVTNLYAWSGSYSLNLGGGGGVATTKTVDTSPCSLVFWSYRGKRGPEVPDALEYLKVQYRTALGTWVDLDAWQGNSITDVTFVARSGFTNAAAALHANLQLQLVTNGSGSGFDDFFIDDFAWGCATDADGDGHPSTGDCNDNDPNTWSSCAACVDVDSDTYYTGCDAYVTIAGPDCNDAAPAIHPGAVDTLGDGIDQNCDGADGVTTVGIFSHDPTPDIAIPAGGVTIGGCGLVGMAQDTIVVGAAGQITDVNVSVNIRHTWDADVQMFVEFSNHGTPICVELSTGNGGSTDNYTATTFDDEATTSITLGVPPFTGSFRPEGLLSAFDGVSMDGTWTLFVGDQVVADTGTLDSWSLTVVHN